MFLSNSRNKGFTLVEMMVVIAIMVIMTGVVLSNLPAFRDKTSLDLVAQEIAITIREAQVFGVSTRVAGGSFSSHGIYLDHSTPSATDHFVLFADGANGQSVDNHYNGVACGTSTTECVELFKLTGGITITNLTSCSDNSCSTPLSLADLNIIFQRPDPEAHFYNTSGSSLPPIPTGPSYVKITIKDSKGNLKNVLVWRSGHIYVE